VLQEVRKVDKLRGGDFLHLPSYSRGSPLQLLVLSFKFMIVLIKPKSLGAPISFPFKCIYINDYTEGLCKGHLVSCEV
jgi:hypothetical protein